MSISTEITRIKNNIANAYTAAGNKGASLPSTKNSSNLASTISSITATAPATWQNKNWTGGSTLRADGSGAVTIMNYVAGAPVRISGTFGGYVTGFFDTCGSSEYLDIYTGGSSTNAELPTNKQYNNYSEMGCSGYVEGAVTLQISNSNAVISMRVANQSGYWFDDSAGSGGDITDIEGKGNSYFTITSIQQHHS